MARKLQSDKLLFLAIVLLVGASIVMVYSASAVVAMDRYEQPYLFLFKQVTWAVLGVFLLGMMMRIDYRNYKQPVVIWTALAVVVVALVAVLFSPEINGTRRWFALAGIGVQPSEFAKLVTVLFTAAVLDRRMSRIDDLSFAVLPIGIVVGGLVGLIMLEP
ncbi:MAG TPA: FtsW/RodA/SpoVE family cell cycle protein, partial [Dehalococcoidia bacterium]|nr:FtsW/RodA/SpoVE family cell cycle protein [Dehalococcoidia bacterium]